LEEHPASIFRVKEQAKQATSKKGAALLVLLVLIEAAYSSEMSVVFTCSTQKLVLLIM
jgi:hypothetical protein